MMKCLAFFLLLASTSNAIMVAKFSKFDTTCEDGGQPSSFNYDPPMEILIGTGGLARRVNCETNKLEIDNDYNVFETFDVETEMDLGECMDEAILGYTKIECVDLEKDEFVAVEEFTSCSDGVPSGPLLLELYPTEQCHSSLTFYDNDVDSFQASCTDVSGKLVVRKWNSDSECTGEPDSTVEIAMNGKCDPNENVVATCGALETFKNSSAAAINTALFVLPMVWLLFASKY